MIDIQYVDDIPDKLKMKARRMLNLIQIGNFRWKKLKSLPKYLAFRLNPNYRILLSDAGLALVCNHDTYARKIKTLKRKVA